MAAVLLVGLVVVLAYPNLPEPQFNGQYYDDIGRAFRIAVMYRL